VKIPVVLLSAALMALAACHSYHIDATVVNYSGAPVELLEVEYPSASFGANSLAADTTLPYRFQVRGSGRLKVKFNTAGGHQVQAEGPALSEHQEGSIEIVLLPDSRVEFHAHLTPQE
jgi:hypothetical protein